MKLFCLQLDIAAKYKMVMEELQFLPVTIDGLYSTFSLIVMRFCKSEVLFQ